MSRRIEVVLAAILIGGLSSAALAQDRPVTADGQFDKKAAKQENREVGRDQVTVERDQHKLHMDEVAHRKGNIAADRARLQSDRVSYKNERRDANVNPHHRHHHNSASRHDDGQ